MSQVDSLDFLVIGSGFGGSVSALRLVEKGYSVAVIERGRRFADSDFAKTNWNLRRYLWLPLLKCFGIQNLTLFKNILILSGTGVGGGSLVYANTLLKPGDGFFEAPDWRGLADWKSELSPHYETARKMLGVIENPRLGVVDRLLQECAQDLGREETFRPSQVGVFFGEPGKQVGDPYFGGQGPDRAGCTFCGGCMVGCRFGAKNTLVKNYLYFAEKRGAKILPERQVLSIRPLGGDGSQGYDVEIERSTAWFRKERQVLRAKNVVLSAGVLGTLNLLLRCQQDQRSLPRLSKCLGQGVRTNSEALLGVTAPSAARTQDLSEGIAITSIFHPDVHTHIEPVRYSKGSSFMRVLAVPMRTKPLRWISQMIRLGLNRRWAETSIIFLVMQTLDNRMQFRLGRGLFTFFRKGLLSGPQPGTPLVPNTIPIGNEVAKSFARKLGGIPQSAINEVLLKIPTTAHILGGCSIGASPDSGVVDAQHRVFGYRGLYVADGSVIPANLGVNPSLTITAMTERAMSFIPTASAQKNL